MPDVAESALAELSAAATAYLRDPAGLLRLVKARDRADAFLGKRHTRQCNCGAPSGFHSRNCGSLADDLKRGD